MATPNDDKKPKEHTVEPPEPGFRRIIIDTDGTRIKMVDANVYSNLEFSAILDAVKAGLSSGRINVQLLEKKADAGDETAPAPSKPEGKLPQEQS